MYPRKKPSDQNTNFGRTQETRAPSMVTKTEFKMKNHNYQIPEESKENHSPVPESDNNEELKFQKAFLNLRGTSQFNFVKTRKPVQHRTTKMPKKNSNRIISLMYPKKKPSNQNTNFERTPSFVSYGQKLKVSKRNHYPVINNLKKIRTSSSSVFRSPLFSSPSLASSASTLSSVSSSSSPPILGKGQSIKNQIIRSDQLHIHPNPHNSKQTALPFLMKNMNGFFSTLSSQPTQQSQFLDEFFKESFSPRKMDILDGGYRPRTMLDNNDDTEEDDNIGVIDYTQGDIVNKPFSLGFQPPAIW